MKFFDVWRRLMGRSPSTESAPDRPLQKLIDLWRDSEVAWELRHVARNLALDGKGLAIDHPDFKTCGDRLDSDMLRTLEVQFEKLIEDNVAPRTGRRSTEEWGRAWEDVERELQKGASAVRRKLEKGIRPDMRVNADSDRPVPLVRYVPCFSIGNDVLDKPFRVGHTGRQDYGDRPCPPSTNPTSRTPPRPASTLKLSAGPTARSAHTAAA